MGVFLTTFSLDAHCEKDESFRHLLFIGEYGNIVQFDKRFDLERSLERLRIPIWGKAGILSSTISPDRTRVFLGYQGKESPLAVVDAPSASLIELSLPPFPGLKTPYWAYEPTRLVALSNTCVYLVDESFWVQPPPFDAVIVDLEGERIRKRTFSRREVNNYFRQSMCEVSPDGNLMFYADPYGIQLLDVKTDTTVWSLDHGAERHDIVSRKIDWATKSVELTWVLHSGDSEIYEYVVIDLQTQKEVVVPVEKPWTIENYKRETFWGYFLTAYAECEQQFTPGDPPILNDQLRAVKEKLTDRIMELLPHSFAQVYISPDGDYILVNKYPAYDTDNVPGGWTLIDLEHEVTVSNDLAKGMVGFEERLIGVYFTN